MRIMALACNPSRGAQTPGMITLGIETSCDETSVALLDGRAILANEIYTQEAHSAFGGVVPEVASRAHLAKIHPLTAGVLSTAGIKPADIGLIAVTDSPGLAGALLVGIGFALGVSTAYATPITGINHLEGHICSALLAHPDVEFPFLALVVSGGHTAVYQVNSIGDYALLGQTVDDAAGEAFDKVGKLLGFRYPAGRSIEEEARKAVSAPVIRFPIARVSAPGIAFSFSGLKTAVRNHIGKLGANEVNDTRALICRSFQEAVVEALLRGVTRASTETGINRVVLVGGVACNGRLREALGERFGATLFFPPPRLCTDNAAMIALAGAIRMERGMLRYPSMNPSSRLG